MTGWEIEDLIEKIENAQKGDAFEIDTFINQYPLAACNEDYTGLIILRKFAVTGTDDNRYFMNCASDDDHFQYGMTIVTIDDKASSEFRIFLPNDYEYQSLELCGSEVKIVAKDFIKTTNITEILRKCGSCESIADIKRSFNSLCNEVYEERKKPDIRVTEIDAQLLGKLSYNEKYEQYEGKVILKGKPVSISLDVIENQNIDPLIVFAIDYFKNKKFNKAISEMMAELYQLKNESWMDDNEKVSLKSFKKALTLSEIVFHHDLSVELYLNDSDMFGGHFIVVSIDNHGNYKNVSLAG